MAAAGPMNQLSVTAHSSILTIWRLWVRVYVCVCVCLSLFVHSWVLERAKDKKAYLCTCGWMYMCTAYIWMHVFQSKQSTAMFMNVCTNGSLPKIKLKVIQRTTHLFASIILKLEGTFFICAFNFLNGFISVIIKRELPLLPRHF